MLFPFRRSFTTYLRAPNYIRKLLYVFYNKYKQLLYTTLLYTKYNKFIIFINVKALEFNSSTPVSRKIHYITGIAGIYFSDRIATVYKHQFSLFSAR